MKKLRLNIVNEECHLLTVRLPLHLWRKIQKEAEKKMYSNNLMIIELLNQSLSKKERENVTG